MELRSRLLTLSLVTLTVRPLPDREVRGLNLQANYEVGRWPRRPLEPHIYGRPVVGSTDWQAEHRCWRMARSAARAEKPRGLGRSRGVRIADRNDLGRRSCGRARSGGDAISRGSG